MLYALKSSQIVVGSMQLIWSVCLMGSGADGAACGRKLWC